MLPGMTDEGRAAIHRPTLQSPLLPAHPCRKPERRRRRVTARGDTQDLSFIGKKSFRPNARPAHALQFNHGNERGQQRAAIATQRARHFAVERSETASASLRACIIPFQPYGVRHQPPTRAQRTRQQRCDHATDMVFNSAHGRKATARVVPNRPQRRKLRDAGNCQGSGAWSAMRCLPRPSVKVFMALPQRSKVRLKIRVEFTSFRLPGPRVTAIEAEFVLQGDDIPPSHRRSRTRRP